MNVREVLYGICNLLESPISDSRSPGKDTVPLIGMLFHLHVNLHADENYKMFVCLTKPCKQ